MIQKEIMIQDGLKKSDHAEMPVNLTDNKQLEKTNIIIKILNATGIMLEVFYHIWQYQTGQIGSTPIRLMPGYNDSKVRYIYKEVNGVIVEHIVERTGELIAAYKY